ncbi:MAG: hypothetical protein NTZ80_03475 [Patescibacteria group bacterium]|nr:hypothetical protein [Patescibacteria group bacterium]
MKKRIITAAILMCCIFCTAAYSADWNPGKFRLIIHTEFGTERVKGEVDFVPDPNWADRKVDLASKLFFGGNFHLTKNFHITPTIGFTFKGEPIWTLRAQFASGKFYSTISLECNGGVNTNNYLLATAGYRLTRAIHFGLETEDSWNKRGRSYGFGSNVIFKPCPQFKVDVALYYSQLGEKKVWLPAIFIRVHAFIKL